MKRIAFIIACLLMTLFVWSGGTHENNPPVPETASWLIGADIQSLSNSTIFESLFSLFPFFKLYGLPEEADLRHFDQLLLDKLGFSMKDIDRFYLWNNNLDLLYQARGFGYIVKTLDRTAENLLDGLKMKHAYSRESDLSQDIIVINYATGKMYLAALGPYLCLSESREILSQMIQVYQSKGGIKSHKTLYPLYTKNFSQSVFICADLRYQKAQWLTPPLDMVELFSASISLNKNILIFGEMIQGSEKKAKQFYNMFVLALNLISQLVPSDRPEIKEAYKFLMKPLIIEQKGKQILFNCEYNKDVLIHLKTLLEFGVELLYSGSF